MPAHSHVERRNRQFATLQPVPHGSPGSRLDFDLGFPAVLQQAIDDGKVSTHVNMAVCYMRLAEAWRAREAHGEEVPEAWHTKPAVLTN